MSLETFRQVVRAAFSTRRKTLNNALRNRLPLAKEHIVLALAEAGIDGQRRGETLSLAEFVRLANRITTLLQR